MCVPGFLVEVYPTPHPGTTGCQTAAVLFVMNAILISAYSIAVIIAASAAVYFVESARRIYSLQRMSIPGFGRKGSVFEFANFALTPENKTWLVLEGDKPQHPLLLRHHHVKVWQATVPVVVALLHHLRILGRESWVRIFELIWQNSWTLLQTKDH